MRKRRTDLKIPYGIMDFRRLRKEGYYYVDKTEFLAQMEARDSFIVEFKYVKKGAKKAELEAQRKEGIAQLKAYAKDKKIPALAKGTTLHIILVQYRGPKMCNCELVGEKRY